MQIVIYIFFLYYAFSLWFFLFNPCPDLGQLVFIFAVKDTSRRAEHDCFLALKGTIVPWLRHKCFDQRSIAAAVLH